MSRTRYSVRADLDIEEIAAFTIERWGSEQARVYVTELRRVCRILARQPEAGRGITGKRPGWRRFEHASHVILYSIESDGIMVQRIVHKARLLSNL